MKLSYGVVFADDDSYILAVTGYDDAKKRSVLIRQRRWESQKALRRILLLNKGVYFGVQSWCRSRAVDRNAETQTFTERRDGSGQERGAVFSAWTSELQLHREAFKANLLGVVPRDLFLTTVPRHFGGVETESFITVVWQESSFLIGVTISRTLVWCSTLAPGSTAALASHLARIERYWKLNDDSYGPFPEYIYTIGKLPPEFSDGGLGYPCKQICAEITDINVLRAMGVSSAGSSAERPLFQGPTTESGTRNLRLGMYIVSALMLGISLAGIAGFFLLNWYYTDKKETYKDEYQKVIVHNQEIKNLLKSSDKLAETIMRMENTLKHRTVWGQFFQFIGEQRSGDLYFEKFGSEPVQNNTAVVRIAISGWTTRESSVTQFIGKLQELPFITRITLSSLERDQKDQTNYRFKIICSFVLNGH